MLAPNMGGAITESHNFLNYSMPPPHAIEGTMETVSLSRTGVFSFCK